MRRRRAKRTYERSILGLLASEGIGLHRPVVGASGPLHLGGGDKVVAPSAALDLLRMQQATLDPAPDRVPVHADDLGRLPNLVASALRRPTLLDRAAEHSEQLGRLLSILRLELALHLAAPGRASSNSMPVPVTANQRIGLGVLRDQVVLAQPGPQAHGSQVGQTRPATGPTRR